MTAPLANRVLTRLERRLGLDLRYLLSGGFFLALTQVTSALIALGMTIAFANWVPVETYGTYRYLIAVYGLFALAALPGIDTAVLRAVSRGEDAAFDVGIRTKFRWGLLGAAAALGYAGYHFHSGSAALGYAFAVMGVALPLMESAALYASLLNGKRLFRAWALLDIFVQGISALALLGTIRFISTDIVALAIAYFGSYVLARGIALLVSRMRYARNAIRDEGLQAYSRSVTLFQVLTRAIASLDQIVLFHLLGPAQVAIFSLATAVPNRIQGILRISGNLAFPKFAKREASEIARSLPRRMVLFSLAVAAGCAAYVAVAPTLFSLLFPQYLASLPYSQAVVFYTLSAITYPFGSYLFAHKRVGDNYVLAVGSFAAKVACLLGLVPWFGVWGAIAGILASAAATIAITGWMLVRDIRRGREAERG